MSANFDFGDSSNNAETNDESDDSPDMIEVMDRNSNGFEYNNVPERFAAAEWYWFVNMVSYKWGKEVGDHDDVTSTIYDEGTDRYPNEYIGQSDENPNGCVEDALSPKAYFYRQVAAGSIKKGYGPIHEAYSAFADAKEERGLEHISLEDYKANFETLEMPQEDYGMTTVEERTKPWEDIQIPEPMAEEWDGEPPVLREIETEEEEETEETTETEEDNRELAEMLAEEYPEGVEWDDDEADYKQVAEILGKVPELRGSSGDKRKMVMNMVECSESTFYEGRTFLHEDDEEEEEEETEEESEPEPETEEETETETETEEDNPDAELLEVIDKDELQEQVAEKLVDRYGKELLA